MELSDLENAQRWRYATKRFDPTRKIPDDIWNALEESLVLTPSSFGLQPWKFIVVESLEIKKKLTEFSWRQKQVEECSHYVVFSARKNMNEKYIQKFLERIVEVRKVELTSLLAYAKVMTQDLVFGNRSKIIPEWAARQAYIALGNFMTSCALLKIDACPMEGIEPEKYDEVLGLKDTEYQTVVACAAGFRSPEDKYAATPKVRFSRDSVISRL